MAAQDTPNTTTATAQAPAETAKENAEAVQRAQTNTGNNVRASWRFSLDTMRSNIAHLSPEAKDMLVWCFNWCIDPAHPIFFADFCSRISYSENSMYKIYSGKYKHPETGALMDAPEKMLKAMREFRRLEIARAKMGRKQFVMTPTAKKFFWACDQARKSNTPVMIYGASQVARPRRAANTASKTTTANLSSWSSKR